MSVNTLLFAAVLAAALGFFAWKFWRLITTLRRGKNEDRFDRPGERIRRVLTIAFGQTKLLREPFAGLLHFFIFWGFVILLSAVLESIGEGLIPGFSFAFLGPLYPPLIFLRRPLRRIVVVSALVSIVRRLVAPPARLTCRAMRGGTRS